MLKYHYVPFSTYIVVGLAYGICLFNCKIWLLLFILISLIACFNKKISPAQLNLLIISMLSGCYLYHKQIVVFHNFKAQINHKTFDVTGIVTDYEKTPGNLFKHRITVQINLFTNTDEEFFCKKHIYIYTQKFPAVYICDHVLIENLKFNFSTNNHFEHFLIKNHIDATIFTPKLNFKKKIPATTLPVFFGKINFLKKYKETVLKKINLKMNKDTGTMFNSIFLGNKFHNKTGITKLKQIFQTWGIIHYLARSGLHLVIISAIWQTLCNLLHLPFALSNSIILLFMLIFTLLSWTALPFLRALIMLICYRLCHLAEKQVHVWHILNISCIIMLINNPACIFFLDFQLSFLLTYGLIFFNEILNMKKYFA